METPEWVLVAQRAEHERKVRLRWKKALAALILSIAAIPVVAVIIYAWVYILGILIVLAGIAAFIASIMAIGWAFETILR